MLIPSFEIGWLNAWVFIIPLIAYWLVGIKFLFSKRMPEKIPFKNKKDKILSNILVVILFGSYVYSIFVPLKLGTVWLSIGLVIYIVGIVLVNLAIISFATTPMDKPVTKGIYRFSRNPMDIGFFLVYFGIAIMCTSWVYLVITVAFILIMHNFLPFEEAVTLEKYGKAYGEYMKRTPRWIGLPKSGEE